LTGYTKLYASIIHSTVWRAPDHVRLLWVTMLALCDRDGTVTASVPGLADAARITLEQCVDALETLASPDEWSRTKDNEGRRIEAVDGGWVVLNRKKYRDLESKEHAREKSAERSKRYRDRHGVTSRPVTPGNVSSPPVTPDKDKEESRSSVTRTPARAYGERRRPSTAAPPSDFVATEKHEELARKRGLDCEHELQAFLDKSASKGWVYSDWGRAFSSWLRDNGSHKYDRGWQPPKPTPPPMSAEDVDRENRATAPRLDDVDGETLEMWAGLGRSDAARELERRRESE
jgi:hypothetical protein